MRDDITDIHERIAAAVFERHGRRMSNARRAGGWTNYVWLNDGLALRLSASRGGAV